MNTARELPRRDYDALKEATKALVDGFASLQEAASITRSDPARLSRFGNRHEEGMFAPIDVIADLEARLGTPVVTSILADMSGFILVAKGEVRQQPDFLTHIGCVAKETGEAVSAVAEIVSAQGNQAQKIAKARREIRDAQAALAGAESDLSRLETITPFRRGSAA
jgi:hypothetical protein